MTYFDPTNRDVSQIMDGSETDGRFVFMASRNPVPLRAEVVSEGPVPEGAIPVEVYRRDTGSRVGLFAATEESLDELRALFDRPQRLGMGCQEQDPGMVGQLLVLVPISALSEGLRELSSGREEEPWRDSLPEPPELGETGGEEQFFEAASDEELDEPEEGEQMRFGALHLGDVVRFQSDRSHPGSFVEEAMDLFETAVGGDLPPVAERLLEKLAAPSLDE